MYPIDDRDRVVVLDDLPVACPGVPAPRVVADDGTILIGYYLAAIHPAWGTSGDEEPTAVVAFPWYHASMFGPPNDEVLHGHPLSARGLTPCGAFEVLDSSWIRGLARMNAVHPRHQPERFARLRHFILSFHDSTFECVAPGYEVHLHPGPLSRVTDWMQQQLSNVR